MNTKVIESMAAQLHINAEDLTNAISSDSDELDFNSLGSPIKYYMTEEQKEQLEKNVQQGGYEKGKTAGLSMSLTDLKKSLEIENGEIKTHEELIGHLQTTHNAHLEQQIEEIKKTMGGDVDAQIKLLANEKEDLIGKTSALQKTIDNINKEHSNTIESLKLSYANKDVETQIIKAVSTLNFNVPKAIELKGDEEIQKYLNVKRSNALNLFKATYNWDYTTEGAAIYKDISGKQIKDDYENPLHVDKIILPFAKANYLDVVTEDRRGRGSTDSPVYNGVKSIKTREDFLKYLKDNNIKANTDEADRVFAEAKKINNF